jgi:hypothetical protein
MKPEEIEPASTDPMMEELRKIRDSIGDETSKMSNEEALGWYRHRAEKAAATLGRVLVAHPTIPHAKIMVPQEELSHGGET